MFQFPGCGIRKNVGRILISFSRSTLAVPLCLCHQLHHHHPLFSVFFFPLLPFSSLNSKDALEKGVHISLSNIYDNTTLSWAILKCLAEENYPSTNYSKNMMLSKLITFFEIFWVR